MLKKTILIIDDDNDFRLLFIKTYAGRIEKIVEARTLAEGFEKISTDHPNAVMLDLTLPDSESQKTVEQFKRICPMEALVVVTGDARKETKQKAIRDTAMSCLTKDTVLNNPGMVVAELEQAIDHHEIARILTHRNLKFP